MELCPLKLAGGTRDQQTPNKTSWQGRFGWDIFPPEGAGALNSPGNGHIPKLQERLDSAPKHREGFWGVGVGLVILKGPSQLRIFEDSPISRGL